MPHLGALAIHLCGTGAPPAPTGGGGLGIDVGGLAVVFGIFTLLGLLAAGVTFIVARRLPPPEPAPIPVWNNLPRS